MDERRRLSFGGVADLYDEARPSYPSALVDDVLEYAGAAGATANRVLEVGEGTGKATTLFADRGLDVLAIEPSAAMARIARRNCAAYDNVTIEETEFEQWRPPGHEFRLVFSGQAWHFEGDVWSPEIAGASGFDGAEVRRYQWHSNYTTAEYVALLGTHSACLILDPPEREGLLSDIAAAIDGRGGSFRMTYVTLLGLARAS
jgi:SAM-dependent methyltransferase